MRIVLFALASATLLLSACGTTREEKTVVISPPQGSTVIVPPNGDPEVIPPGH
jgi:outer membrane biogenesis lipoprotein LolB